MVVYDNCLTAVTPTLRSLKEYVLKNPRLSDIRITEVDFSEDLSGRPTLYLEYETPTRSGSYTIDAMEQVGELYGPTMTNLLPIWSGCAGEDMIMQHFLRALERESVVRIDRGSDRTVRYQTLTHSYTLTHDI